MPILALLIAAGASAAVVGVVNYFQEKGRQDKIQQIIDQAKNVYGGLSTKSLEAALNDVVPPSEFAQIQVDPTFKSAQIDALDKMRGIEANGGLTLEDRANLQNVQNQGERAASNRDASIRQDMAARGVGGSGAELAMRLSSGQAAADRENQAGLDIAGQAQKRYFDAVRSRGAYATQLRDQDWNEQAQKAAAQDAISKFNLSRQDAIRQQVFADQTGLADRQYRTYQDQVGAVNDAANRNEQTVANVGNGLSQIAAAAALAPKTKQAAAGGSQYAGTAPPATASDLVPPTKKPEDDKYGYEDYNAVGDYYA